MKKNVEIFILLCQQSWKIKFFSFWSWDRFALKLQQLQLANSFCWICHLSVLCRLMVRHHTVEAESLTDYTICFLCLITPWRQNLSLTTQYMSCTSSHHGGRISHWLHNLCPVPHHTVDAESLTDYTICVLCVIKPWRQNLSPTSQ